MPVCLCYVFSKCVIRYQITVITKVQYPQNTTCCVRSFPMDLIILYNGKAVRNVIEILLPFRVITYAFILVKIKYVKKLGYAWLFIVIKCILLNASFLTSPFI